MANGGNLSNEKGPPSWCRCAVPGNGDSARYRLDPMRSMSGWQRIGVVLSVLWIVGWLVWLQKTAVDGASERFHYCFERNFDSNPRAALVSVRKHFESFESFVIQSGDL